MRFNNPIRGIGTRKIGIRFHKSLMINPTQLNQENELRILRHRVQLVSQKLELIKKRAGIRWLKLEERVVAIVDKEECAGCGICYDVCPQGAISMDITAKIDSSKCTACLECVNRCPRGAIAIKYQDW
jgi:ferredoxin